MITLKKLGSIGFLDLTDVPATYFNTEGMFAQSTGSGIIWAAANSSAIQSLEGITNIPNNVSSMPITFVSPLLNDNYVLTVSLENKIDIEPSVYSFLTVNKTTIGFTVIFSGEIDSDNYYLNWKTTFSGSGQSPFDGSYITELSEDLIVGNNLIMLDPTPSGISIHGYEIGYSGEASEMYVADNPTGFGCPLYMQSNGTWAATCAASGIYNMPCMALALEEGYGEAKKILWGGIIKKGIWNWTPGNKIYVSTVEGAITNVKPNGGSWTQVIGMAIASDTIKFNPDLDSGY